MGGGRSGGFAVVSDPKINHKTLQKINKEQLHIIDIHCIIMSTVFKVAQFRLIIFFWQKNIYQESFLGDRTLVLDFLDLKSIRFNVKFNLKIN